MFRQATRKAEAAKAGEDPLLKEPIPLPGREPIPPLAPPSGAAAPAAPK
jgi:hypothetical protein